MKVLHVCTNDRGGAAHAALRIHDFIKGSGFSSRFMVRKKGEGFNNDVVEFNKKNRSYTFLNKILWKLGIPQTEEQQWIKVVKNYKNQFEFLSSPLTDYDIMQSEHYQWADIIHFHWVANFVDYPSFFRNNQKPLVWTLHDMNPIMGITHYREDAMNSNLTLRKLDKDYQEVKRSCYSIANFPIHIVSPSKWLQGETKESNMFTNIAIDQIEYGMANRFRYIDKQIARGELGLDPDKFYTLFIADFVDNRRKGFDLVEPILTDHDLGNVNWLIAGNFEAVEEYSNVQFLGFLNSYETLNLHYSAADVFVISSKQDNFPNTIIESLISGCPVLGFKVGGISEMIKDGVNGTLITDISTIGLKSGIKNFQEKVELYNRRTISEEAIVHYSDEKTTSKYIELYKSLSN